MAGRIVLIIGLPASGKTYLAKNKYVPLGYRLIDDPKELPVLNKKEDYVICDPWLCDPSIRSCFYLLYGDFEVEEIYFENDHEKCRKNIAERNDGRKIGNLNHFKYQIPEGIKPLKIWQSS